MQKVFWLLLFSFGASAQTAGYQEIREFFSSRYSDVAEYSKETSRYLEQAFLEFDGEILVFSTYVRSGSGTEVTHGHGEEYFRISKKGFLVPALLDSEYGGRPRHNVNERRSRCRIRRKKMSCWVYYTEQWELNGNTSKERVRLKMIFSAETISVNSITRYEGGVQHRALFLRRK